MVAGVSHDSFSKAERLDDLGFWIEVGRGHAPMRCRDVRGFEEALEAARDATAAMPARLVIVDAAIDAGERARLWLDAWSEDTAQVRRAFAIRRAGDGARVLVVATIASHGFGVPTSLSVESVRAEAAGDIARSGVHLTIEAERAAWDDDAWGPRPRRPSNAHEPA